MMRSTGRRAIKVVKPAHDRRAVSYVKQTHPYARTEPAAFVCNGLQASLIAANKR